MFCERLSVTQKRWWIHLIWHLQTTPTSHLWAFFLSAADHTHSEGLTGPLHPKPGGLGKVRHFITLKEERGQILSADLRSNDKQWSEAAWVLARHSTQAWYSPWGFALHVWSPSLFLSGLCASMHMDNMTTLTDWDEPRREKQSSEGCELDCESWIFTALWKRPTNMHTHWIISFSSTLHPKKTILSPVWVSFFCWTQRTIFWRTIGTNDLHSIFFFYYGSKRCQTTVWLQSFFKTSSFVFSRRKKQQLEDE